MRHTHRHLGDERRACACRRFDLEPAADERDALAHPDQAECVLAASCRGRSRSRRPRSIAHDGVALSLEQDADPAGLRVLDDVRQRLLHDAVERGFGLARQPLVAEARLEIDPQAALLAERLCEPLHGRHQPEVVERGRPQLDREPPDVLQGRRRRARAPTRRRRALSSARPPARSASGRAGSTSAPGPSRRGAARASRARSSSCASTTRRTRIAADALREVDRDRRPGRERLRQAQVVLAEGGRLALLVVRDHHADRPPAGDERHEQSRANTEPPRRLLVDLGVVQHRVDALAAAALQDASRLRARELELASRRRRTRPRPRPPRRAASRRPAARSARAARPTSSCRRPATSDRSGSSSNSEASALPISFSDSSWRSQRVELSYSRAFSIATAACAASSCDQLLVLVGEVARRRPSRSDRGCRTRRRGARSGARGTTSSVDGSAETPPSADRRAMSCSRSGCASRISTPRMPRPCGRSPIAACVSASKPVVMNARATAPSCRSRRAPRSARP